jgi:hypothetical protein
MNALFPTSSGTLTALDLLLLEDLKKVVQEFLANGKNIRYSQIYSWLDLHLDGCMSPTDYPPIAALHEEGQFHFYFLWGCVENCQVVWQPPLSPLPPISDWPILIFDNEGYVGYAGTSREAVARLLKDMEREASDENDLHEFVTTVMTTLAITPAEISAAGAEQPENGLFIEHIKALTSLAVM